MNDRHCVFCGKHVWSEEYDTDVCEPSPAGYHRNFVKTWLDSAKFTIGDDTPIDGYEWARTAFSTFDRTNIPADDDSFKRVPAGMRRAMVRLWHCYPMMPNGLCDPMYMVNVIANETAKAT